ncbi:LysR substrate-binding domain-containing protein [Alcaligenes aquatilis]|uniref:LysR family transcriptional regulator n=1 Tax=Alcaligenes aquatilis TaxID=323284 RepID=A0A3G2HRS8_9BURK|nr:LysR substrate-binding domain-containing protein [Alcaligenes aquatilis]AYN19832.1 LysR family transcriptional regulator [Alcaligenes aquatilis]
MQVPLLNALRTFTVSAQRLNFTKAAEDLLVSPSAVSHQIKVLEEYLGCKLFLRKNRSLELTDQGQFLFDRLQRPFYEINQALSELRMPHGKSRINLSLRPFVSSMWFTGQLGDFWLKHPDIEINLLHRLQAPDFFRDNINFAIVWGKQGDWPQLQTLRIIPGNLTPVCAPSYLQAHGQITFPADLNQHVLIHEENQLCWEQWLRKAAGQELTAKKSFHIDDTNVRMNAVLNGQGVMLGCPALLQPLIDKKEIVQLFDVCLEEYAYFLAYPKEANLSRQELEFVDWVASIAIR